MTLSIDGVRLNARRRNRVYSFLILAAEAVLSVFLYMSFAAHFIWPDLSQAAAGISPYLSYEGRLSDSSGNPLGGTGEPYCFRFSIYDSASSGSKLWPAGAPNVTVATTTDGVFSALIGQADALTYNFYDSDTVYLNVDVNTATSTNGTTCSGSWETLSPRQQIASTGYAQSAANVYSALLKTNNSANRIDIGAGTGSGSPTLVALDVNNGNQYVGQTCSTSGTMWYNSAVSAALICEGGIIEELGTTGTTTIAGINANTGTPASAGTVVFSNSNGVSFGINGNTVTASINGAPTLSSFANVFYKPAAQTNQALASTFDVLPIVLSNPVSFNYLRLLNSISIASTSLASTANTTYSYNQAITYRGVLYSKNTGASSLSLASVSSFSAGLTYSLNAAYGSASNTSQYFTMGITYPISTGTSSFSTLYTTNNLSTQALSTGNFTRLTGYKYLDIPFAGTLPAGDYWLAINASTTQTTQGAAALSAARLLYSTIGFSQNNNTFAYFANGNNATVQAQMGVGSFTTNAGATTASLAFSNISSSASHFIPYMSLYATNYY